MKVGDEVYAVEGQYAFVRHGFITSEEAQTDSSTSKITRTYFVSYNDLSPYDSYSKYGKHKEEELFKNRSQATAYANYLRRDV